MQSTQKVKLERATPESLGFSSRAVLDFIKEIEDEGIENHSFMIIRDGKVGAEGWFSPFNADVPHALYSFSKSFSSTAIGFAIDEGLLTVDTKLIDIFPDQKPKKLRPEMEQLTIHHMLTMHSGKKMNLMANKAKIDWIEDFMNAPFHSSPGTRWNYCNENSFMLCAIIHKLTGMSVIDYLMPRLFEPLGIERPYWETNQDGIESGGWGLYLRTEDMAKFILCYLNQGKFNGKQVIPEFWTREATKKHVDNSTELSPDARVGYGYQFWRNAGADGFRADGMFSQHGLALPEYNAVIIVTCSCPLEQKMLNTIWNHFPKAFQDGPLDEDPEAYEALQAKCNSLTLGKLATKPRNKEMEAKISGRKIHFRKKVIANVAGFPAGMLALPITFMGIDKAGNIDNLSIQFKDDADECILTWTEQGKENSVPVGLDGNYRYGKMELGPATFTSCSLACWNEDGTLSMSVRPMEAVSQRDLTFKFKGKKGVVLDLSETPQVSTIADFLMVSFQAMTKSKTLLRAVKIAFNIIPAILDPNLHGKFLD